MANNISFNAPTVVNDVLYPKIVYNATFALAGTSTNVPFAQNEITPFSMIAVSGTVHYQNYGGTQTNGNIYLSFDTFSYTIFDYAYYANISTDMSFYTVFTVVQWTTSMVKFRDPNISGPGITWNQNSGFHFDDTPSLRATSMTGRVNIKFIQF